MLSYLHSIHKDMYNTKCPGYKVFEKDYINRLMLPTNTQIQQIQNLIKPYSHSYNVYKNIPWKFLISKDLEQDLYFTQDDYIIIPQNNIDQLTYKTLLHEKTHIIQRKHQDKFNEWYKKYYYPEFKDVLSINNIKNDVKKHIMVNPDSNGTLWTNTHNNIVFPVYNHYLEYWEYDGENIIPSNYTYDHPNEKFASDLANLFQTDETVPESIDAFLSSLE